MPYIDENDIFKVGSHLKSVEAECLLFTPCEYNDDCGLNGSCSKKFCRCHLGASGDFCEIIDQCESKEVECGSAICALGEKGQAYCRCEYISQGYDYDTKTCKACNCGDKSIYCKFENGTKTCFCKGGYAQRLSECADVACHRYTLNMQVSSGTKNNSSPNEPSCTTVTASFNGVLLVVTGTWRSPY
ncbi:uncharacterized protein TNCV_3028711 [Trichonephila clavipes]|nr:uncharacterized protein TNCV_3028711 [Trichonephila clavipes]